MRFIFLCFLTLLMSPLFGQIVEKNPIIGAFVLDKLEFSQTLDSNRLETPPLHWSLYTERGLSDSLIINDSLEFRRLLNFQNHFEKTLVGRLETRHDTLFVAKGWLFSQDNLTIEKADKTELILVEIFKTRQIRRTFRRF